MLLTFFPYASTRISTWRDPFSSSSDEGPDSPVAVHYRLGRLERSRRPRRSRQKFLYLPEEHNDFIFSVTCEELGFIGAAVILILLDAHSARLLDSAPLPRQVQLSCLRRDNDAAGDTGFF